MWETPPPSQCYYSMQSTRHSTFISEKLKDKNRGISKQHSKVSAVIYIDSRISRVQHFLKWFNAVRSENSESKAPQNVDENTAKLFLIQGNEAIRFNRVCRVDQLADHTYGNDPGWSICSLYNRWNYPYITPEKTINASFSVLTTCTCIVETPLRKQTPS